MHSKSAEDLLQPSQWFPGVRCAGRLWLWRNGDKSSITIQCWLWRVVVAQRVHPCGAAGKHMERLGDARRMAQRKNGIWERINVTMKWPQGPHVITSHFTTKFTQVPRQTAWNRSNEYAYEWICICFLSLRARHLQSLDFTADFSWNYLEQWYICCSLLSINGSVLPAYSVV